MAPQLVTVTGTYFNPDQSPATGAVKFTPTSDWCNGEHVVASPVTAQIIGGVLNAQLLSPDCKGTNPAGVTYKVEESIGGLGVNTYWIDVPCNALTLDLCSVPHGTTPVAVAFYEELAHKNQPNGYAGLDANGLLNPAQLPAVVGTVKSVNGKQPDGTGNVGVFAKDVLGGGAAGLCLVAEPNNQTGAVWTQIGPIDVMAAYGAAGDGSTDDWQQIQTALNQAGPGQVVYLPRTHALSKPLMVPPQVTLRARHGAHVDALTTPSLVALPGFTGAAVILLVDQATGGWAQPSNEQRLEQLSIDCSRATGTVDAIQAQGFVHGVTLLDVQLYKPPGHGINVVSNASGTPYSWRGTRVHVINSGGVGYSVSMTDATWLDCMTLGAGSHGWFMGTYANSMFIGCRAEWSANDGFNLGGSTGTGTGSGGASFIGCTTDRNAHNGFQIVAAGNAPISLTGCSTRRDGSASASAGYAGINVNGATAPVIIDGFKSYVGTNDDGTGTASPQYGLAVTNAATVNYTACYLHAITAGFFDGGGNTTVRRGLNIEERTGPSNAPVVVQRGLRTYGTYGDSLDVPGHLAGMPAPRDHQAIAWTDPPTAVTGGQLIPNSGEVHLSALYVPRATPAVKLTWGITTPGAGPVAGQNFIALLDAAGNVVASVNIDARVTAVANSIFNEVIAANVAAGVYYVAWLFNCATLPTVLRGPVINATLVNFGLTPATARYATNGTGQTALPNPVNLANNAFSSTALWAALS